MRRRATVIFTLVICPLLRPVSGQCPVDPSDRTLCVYKLTAAQAAEFDASDGMVSAFWSNWTDKDYIRMVPPDNCYPSRCALTDSADASMTVRAAATERALYLYAEVTGDVWVDWPGGDEWGQDAVEVYTDQLAADAIWTCPDCLIGLYDTRFTWTTLELLVYMGSQSPPTQFTRVACDEGIWCEFFWITMTFEAARIIHGFEAEVIPVHDGVKVQEWYVPWVFYGQGLVPGTDLADRRFAFSVGYNDMDSDSATADCLRWLGKDPWTSDSNTVNYWGDLLLPSDVGAVEPYAAVAKPRGAAGTGTARHVLPQAQVYSLDGRRHWHQGQGPVPGIYVQRLPTGGTTICCYAHGPRDVAEGVR